MDLSRLIAFARGDEPADLILSNGRLVNVLSGEVYPTDVVLAESFVVGLGPGYRAREVMDLNGRHVCPGFIDAHVHLESSLVLPAEFARAIVPRGVTTVVTNLHGIMTDTSCSRPEWRVESSSQTRGRDLSKMAVIERHRGTGSVGVGIGFVRGLGLKVGAIASSVAHDHHNLVVAGADDPSMRAAAESVSACGGGQAAALGDKVLARLALPIAGLISDQSLETVRAERDRLLGATRELGSPLRDPLEALNFLALEVVPPLKLTDRGLVDVAAGTLVPLFVQGENHA